MVNYAPICPRSSSSRAPALYSGLLPVLAVQFLLLNPFVQYARFRDRRLGVPLVGEIIPLYLADLLGQLPL
jgi:hypothetical protein